MFKIASCDDYATAIQSPQLIRAKELIGGRPIMNGIRPEMYTGGFCAVFPYTTQTNKKYAVRCWHAYLNNAQEKAKIVSSYLKKQNLPYFVNFEYIEYGIATANGVMPVVLMDWVNAHSFKEYLKIHLNDSAALNRLALHFLEMVVRLHKAQISHGDLQQGNIMVKDDGSIVLVDYDSMYVPGLEQYECEIPGTPGYQHPTRFKTKLNLSPNADYFSELIIYLSIKALSISPKLWQQCNIENTDTLLFSKEDLESKGKSSIFKELESLGDDISILVQILKKYLLQSNVYSLKPFDSFLKVHKETLLSRFCTECGIEFPNVNDRYCIRCGHKRI